MRTTLIICFAMALLAVPVGTVAYGQQNGFGAGIIVGEPTGLSVKGWTSGTNAIDAGIAWSFRTPSSFHIHADYLWHNFSVFKTTEIIPLYYGVGGRVKIGREGEDSHFGVRVVIGVDYMFRDAPVDIFLELAPVMDLAPSTELTANGGLGVRFWFK